MEKKWYIICQSAEEDQYSVVELTPDQAENFRYVLDNLKYVGGGGWCGSIYMYQDGFDTYEEACNNIWDNLI